MSLSTSTSDKARSPLRWRSIGSYLTILACSVLLMWGMYILGAATALRNAVVLRSTKEMIEAKLTPLQAARRPPYLVVVSGSNALYSIDSPTLSAGISMPVVNAAMQWSYVYYTFSRAVSLAKAGDVFLLPLEYEYFSPPEDRPQLEACYLVLQDRDAIAGPAAFVTMLIQCNPRVVFDALFAQLASALGLPRPSQPIRDILSPEGDILENAAGINRWRSPTGSTIAGPPGQTDFGNHRFAELIRAATAKGVKVYLTYPVHPEKSGDFPAVAKEWLDAYGRWAMANGATVVSHPEDHLFPTSCFFDSPYHLHRGCSPRNSQVYARAILPLLNTR